MPEFVVGVDLGQASDYTAISVLEVDRGGEGDARFACRHLERLELGMSYPRQVERMDRLHAALRQVGVPDGAGGLLGRRSPSAVRLVVDQTGVGRAVVDLLREVNLDAVAVSITGGDSIVRVGHREVRVPKRDLVSGLVVAVQTGRLRVAAAAPLARELADELLGFKVSVNARGHDKYGDDVGAWRETAHDDLVLATALAVWYANEPFQSLTWGR